MRRWNRDLIVKSWESTYATFSNNPIYFIDSHGLTASGNGDKDKAPKEPRDSSNKHGYELCKGCDAQGEDVYKKKPQEPPTEPNAPKNPSEGSIPPTTPGESNANYIFYIV